MMTSGILSGSAKPLSLLARSRLTGDLYGLVPKDPVLNAEWRLRILRRSKGDQDLQLALWIGCKRDILFFVNAFLWTYDPRLEKSGRPVMVPFVTWPFQDEVLLEIGHALGRHDLLIAKSRDMGVTWMVLVGMFHRWMFFRRQSFKVGSRKQDLVDHGDDPDTLFAKLDMMYRYLPPWMKPSSHRIINQFLNIERRSVIDGEASGPEFGRGGRRTAIFNDEYAFDANQSEVEASTSAVTQSRIQVSTPNGPDNEFAKKFNGGHVRALRLLWSLHPVKGVGVTFGRHDEPTSPWFIEECGRLGWDRLRIARELMISFESSSGYPFFEPSDLDDYADLYVQKPFQVGNLAFDPDTYRPLDFVEGAGGKLLLWCNLDGMNRPMGDRRYGMGMDISAGSGASATAVVVVDLASREVVGVWSDAHTSPAEMVGMFYALAWFFRGSGGDPAYGIWESNGPTGASFTKQITDRTDYRHCYFRRREDSLGRKMTDQMGWVASKSGKRTLFEAMRRDMKYGNIVIRDIETVQEFRRYLWTEDGSIEHAAAGRKAARGVDERDPSGARDNHGDRAMAAALANKLLAPVESVGSVPAAVEPEPDSFRRRQLARRDVERSESESELIW